MNHLRIGTDRKFLWAITINGEEPDLSTYDSVDLFVSCPGHKFTPQDVVLDGNVIIWKFKGKDQRYLGPYSLTVVINDGMEDMHTFDICDAFSLVSCSCKESHGDTLSPIDVTPLYAAGQLGAAEIYPILRVKAKGEKGSSIRELIIESSHCIDNETVSIARLLTATSRVTYWDNGAWQKVSGRKRNGWRIDRRFSTKPTGKKGTCLELRLERVGSPAPESDRTPRKLYAYKLIWLDRQRPLRIQDLISPWGFYFRDASEDDGYSISWGRHAKYLPWFDEESGATNQKHFQFGIAVGRQIAPFRLRIVNHLGHFPPVRLTNLASYDDRLITFVG